MHCRVESGSGWRAQPQERASVRANAAQSELGDICHVERNIGHNLRGVAFVQIPFQERPIAHAVKHLDCNASTANEETTVWQERESSDTSMRSEGSEKKVDRLDAERIGIFLRGVAVCGDDACWSRRVADLRVEGGIDGATTDIAEKLIGAGNASARDDKLNFDKTTLLRRKPLAQIPFVLCSRHKVGHSALARADGVFAVGPEAVGDTKASTRPKARHDAFGVAGRIVQDDNVLIAQCRQRTAHGEKVVEKHHTRNPELCSHCSLVELPAAIGKAETDGLAIDDGAAHRNACNLRIGCNLLVLCEGEKLADHWREVRKRAARVGVRKQQLTALRIFTAQLQPPIGSANVAQQQHGAFLR
eukprot:m.300024 g.300024  ORF g.300024 m.300024 type:complete len:360 (+) comp14324_c0_seq1:125-1204(+)